MSAGSVGAQMPTQITLDDLAVMAAADENHRYELSPEGVLSVAPSADPDHALLVSRLFAWFLTHGYGPEEVVTECGIDVGGGRVPDLTLWAKGTPPRPARSSYAGTDGLLLAVEVVSRGSEIVDRVIKKLSTPRPASQAIGWSSATASPPCCGTHSIAPPVSTSPTRSAPNRSPGCSPPLRYRLSADHDDVSIVGDVAMRWLLDRAGVSLHDAIDGGIRWHGRTEGRRSPLGPEPRPRCAPAYVDLRARASGSRARAEAFFPAAPQLRRQPEAGPKPQERLP
jgi:hypothetical protein